MTRGTFVAARALPLRLAILVAVLLPTGVYAQAGFFGIAGVALWNFDPQTPPNIGLGVQVGAEIRPSISVRLLTEIYPFEPGSAAYRVAFDALYTVEVTTETIGYYGGGAGLLISPVEGVFPDIHVTGGIESFVSGEIGVFGEVQLLVIVPLIRVGVNYHF